MSTEALRSQTAKLLIGNYAVIRKLATGGMGEVYLAQQTGPVDFRRQVVLKRLHPRFTSDPRFVKMFLNEARIAANLAHPNIIHIYELIEDGDGYVIAMEYVRGGTVLSLLRALEGHGGASMPHGPLVRIAVAVCEALHHAYNEADSNGVPHHVIHRDVNPSNVLIGYDGQVKLADFGIAKALEEDGVTQAKTIKGKFGYLTPEQIKCQPLDQRSDLFSLGTMLWEMSVGKRLFQRETEMQMLYAILEERIPMPSEFVLAYPKDLERVVMKALARSREDRYNDANELANDLRASARDNRWDIEKSALSKLIKENLPDDQVAFGQISSDPFGAASSQARRRVSTTGSWADSDSFASMVVIDAQVPPVSSVIPSNPWLTRRALTTVVVWLVLSVAFWRWLVPVIDP